LSSDEATYITVRMRNCQTENATAIEPDSDKQLMVGTGIHPFIDGIHYIRLPKTELLNF
jgi:hypothetical protein